MFPWWSYTCSTMSRFAIGSHDSAPHPEPCTFIAASVSCAREGVERAEVLGHRGPQLALGLATRVGGEVLPEQRVQDMTRQVEGHVLLELVDGPEITGFASLAEFLEGGVRTRHVTGVVLAVMQFEDLGGEVRLERVVRVVQVGKGVRRHGDVLPVCTASHCARDARVAAVPLRSEGSC